MAPVVNSIHTPYAWEMAAVAKDFLKTSLRETEQDVYSYPRYRHRTSEEGGGSAAIKVKLEGCSQNVEIHIQSMDNIIPGFFVKWNTK